MLILPAFASQIGGYGGGDGPITGGNLTIAQQEQTERDERRRLAAEQAAREEAEAAGAEQRRPEVEGGEAAAERRQRQEDDEIANPEGAEVPPVIFTDPSKMSAPANDPALMEPLGVEEELILSGIDREGSVNPADALTNRPSNNRRRRRRGRRGSRDDQGATMDETVLVGKTKPIIRYNTIYNFQNSDQLIDNPASNLEYQQRHNTYINDLVRRMSLRLWYGYGWASPRWGISDSNKPMFGYFPVTNEKLDPEVILSDLKKFHTNFSNNALIFGDRSLNIYDNNYFDYMPSRTAPLIYISDFGDERYILREIQSIACEEEFGPSPESPSDPEGQLATPQPGEVDVDAEVAEVREAVEEFGIFPDGVPNIEINHWRRSVVTIKKFNALPLDSRLADFETDFRSLAAIVENFLNQYEIYSYGDETDECGDKLEDIRIPKRYFDYNFQVPLLDEQVKGTANYNGYFSSIYETVTDINNTPLPYSSLFPNLYMIDFATTTIEEYYKLFSLNGMIEGFPDRRSEEYQNLFDDFRYANTDEYIRIWARGLAKGVEEEPLRMLALAVEYQKLILSNVYAEQYKIVSETGRRQSQMNNTIDFAILSDTHIFNPSFNGVSNLIYDPITHLVSDTQITEATVASRQLFAEPHLGAPLTSEFIRRNREHSNASTQPSVMQKREDLLYATNNVWNLHEWFDLYCIPEFTACSDIDWGCFYREYPEQEAMLHKNLETFVLDPVVASVNKPVPIGGQPEFSVGPGTTVPGTILITPDGEQWGQCYGIENFVSSLADLYSNLNEKLRDTNFRTYREVMDGKLAYSETLFYRLERRPKGDINPGGENFLIQNFFLPASLVEKTEDNPMGFSYVDTQVHYGVEYEYNLYGYHFVLGNEYWYDIGQGQEETSLEEVQGAREILDAANAFLRNEEEEEAASAASEAERCQDIFDSYSPHNFFNEDRGPVRDFNENGCPYNFFDADGRLHVVIDCRNLTMTSPLTDSLTFRNEDGECPPRFYDKRGNLQVFDRETACEELVMYEFLGTYVSNEAGNVEALDAGGQYYQKIFLGFEGDDYEVRIDPATGRERGPDDRAESDVVERRPRASGVNHIRKWFRRIESPSTCPDKFYTFRSELQSEAIGGRVALYEILGDPKFRKVFQIADHSVGAPSTTPEKPLPEELFNLVDYSFPVNNRPHLALVETRAFSSDVAGIATRILDSPPLPPDVDIIPYRSTKNKMLHMLNGNVGNYKDNPILIEPGDFDKFKNIIVNQDNTLDPNEVTERNIEEEFEISFKTDDYPELFEIFRIDFEPKSYKDFARGRKIILDNTARVTSTLAQRALRTEEFGTWRDQVIVTSNSIVDDIVPNKKYWYTFRVVDIHDNVSNPSGILQVEMVDTGNSIFPMIEEYIFPKPEVTYVRDMKRFLKIAVSPTQDELSPEVRNADDFYDKHSILGADASADVPGGSVWGKNYKLRLTSKLTGKKVDINFTFEQGSVDDRRGE